MPFLHDLHEAVGIEDLELPIRERAPELFPADHFEPIVPPLCELNPVRALDTARSKSFLLRLLDGRLDAHGFHDQSDPSETQPHNEPRADVYRGRYIIVVFCEASPPQKPSIAARYGGVCRALVRPASGVSGMSM